MIPPRIVSIVALGLTLYALPPATLAQQPVKVYRIGVLSTVGPEQENFVWTDLRRLLRDRGWVEGQNLVIDWRYAEAKYEPLPDMAAELVRLQPDLIMAYGGYGEDEREVPRRLAVYVDKVLRGAKPADLPVQRPTKFDLLLNLKTANAMGLTFPKSVLLRADEVIR